MSDLSALLTEYSATTSLPARGPATEDLARARRALRRHRARRVGSRTGLLAIAVAAAVTVAPNIGTSSAPDTSTARGGAVVTDTARGSAVVTSTTGIALVSYSGAQLGGYTVDSVPDGWAVETANGGLLTVAPLGRGVTENFDGEILVSRLSKDSTIPSKGTAVMVGSARGVITDTADNDGSRFLSYVDPDTGFAIQVQFPAVLRTWTPEQLAQFAAGVHVPALAQGTAS